MKVVSDYCGILGMSITPVGHILTGETLNGQSKD